MGVIAQGGPAWTYCLKKGDLESKAIQVCEVHQEYLHVFKAILVILVLI